MIETKDTSLTADVNRAQVTTAQVMQQYERDGYVLFPQVLDADLMAEARAHLDWLIQKHPDVRPEHLGHTLVANDPFWLRLVSDDRLLDIAEKFIGPDIALFASHYIAKPAFDGRPVLWHQDGSYWPLDPMKVVTLWLAVDDATTENGCLRVIPGSHIMNLQEMHHREDIQSVLSSSIDDSYVDEGKAVDCALLSGGVEVHHPNIIHGSEANHSPRRRAGLTIRYIPTSTRITTPNWPCAFLLRGEAVPGVNDYLPRPKYSVGQHMPFHGAENWK
jgi:ectoine hydroxylase-related dioxygenase (phytanoyl-CoA dioxygenase family)